MPIPLVFPLPNGPLNFTNLTSKDVASQCAMKNNHFQLMKYNEEKPLNLRNFDFYSRIQEIVTILDY